MSAMNTATNANFTKKTTVLTTQPTTENRTTTPDQRDDDEEPVVEPVESGSPALQGTHSPHRRPCAGPVGKMTSVTAVVPPPLPAVRPGLQ